MNPIDNIDDIDNIEDRLHPFTESDNDGDDGNDYDYNYDNYNNIANIDDYNANINNPDHELEQALQSSLKDYNESQQRIRDAYHNIIHSNDEYLKSLILESLSSTEIEYVLKMVEKFNTNTANRLLMEQQELEYENSVNADTKKKLQDKDMQDKDIILSDDIYESITDNQPIEEIKVFNKDELRNERLKFFTKNNIQ